VSDLLPATDETYNLGSLSKKWKELYLSSSLNLGGAVKFPNMEINELSPEFLRLVSKGTTTLKHLMLAGLYAWSIEGSYPWLTIRPMIDPWCGIAFQVWVDAWISCLEIKGGNYGGYVDIPRCGDVDFRDDKFLKIGKDSDGALPTASSTYRGKMIRVEGGAGVADKLYCCMKSASDVYSWVQVASG